MVGNVKSRLKGGVFVMEENVPLSSQNKTKEFSGIYKAEEDKKVKNENYY